MLWLYVTLRKITWIGNEIQKMNCEKKKKSEKKNKQEKSSMMCIFSVYSHFFPVRSNFFQIHILA